MNIIDNIKRRHNREQEEDIYKSPKAQQTQGIESLNFIECF